MNKTTRFITALFCIILAVIIGFYQVKLKTVKGNKTTPVVVATSNVFRGDELTTNNTIIKHIDVESVVKDAYKNQNDVLGKIASENFRENEQMIPDKMVTKEKWAEGEKTIVSIECLADKDSFTAYEVRPLDKVNIYFIPDNPKLAMAQVMPQYPASSEILNGLKPFLESVEIIDTKSAEGVSFKDKVSGQPFLTKYALFLVDKKVADQIQTLKAVGGYFSLSINGQRPTIENSKKTPIVPANSGVIFN